MDNMGLNKDSMDINYWNCSYLYMEIHFL